jgi:hypothetical protein
MPWPRGNGFGKKCPNTIAGCVNSLAFHDENAVATDSGTHENQGRTVPL